MTTTRGWYSFTMLGMIPITCTWPWTFGALIVVALLCQFFMYIFFAHTRSQSRGRFALSSGQCGIGGECCALLCSRNDICRQCVAHPWLCPPRSGAIHFTSSAVILTLFCRSLTTFCYIARATSSWPTLASARYGVGPHVYSRSCAVHQAGYELQGWSRVFSLLIRSTDSFSRHVTPAGPSGQATKIVAQAMRGEWPFLNDEPHLLTPS